MDIEPAQTYQLKLTVRNRPGVLVRCAQVMGRRGQNIESLHVAAIPDQPELSYMTITASGRANAMNQVTGQLYKLIDVINVN